MGIEKPPNQSRNERAKSGFNELPLIGSSLCVVIEKCSNPHYFYYTFLWGSAIPAMILWWNPQECACVIMLTKDKHFHPSNGIYIDSHK